MKNSKKQCGHLRCGATCRFGKKVVKRKPIRKVSKKREDQNAEYFRLREKFLKEHPKCECGRDGCRRKATEVHHTRGRGRYFLVVSTWLAVARVCHRWITDNEKAAKERGLSASRLADNPGVGEGRKILYRPDKKSA